MSEEVIIQGDDVQIVLRVLGRESAQAISASDADWLRATLSIRASSFAGTIDLEVWLPELMTLRDKLEAILITLKEGLQFQSMEANWEFNVAFEASGTALISGLVRPRRSWNNSLQYEFRSDPISLESVARQIRHITDKYAPTNRTAERTREEIA